MALSYIRATAQLLAGLSGTAKAATLPPSQPTLAPARLCERNCELRNLVCRLLGIWDCTKSSFNWILGLLFWLLRAINWMTRDIAQSSIKFSFCEA
ncbi:hypothetical protein LINPERPRIM_LOCUS33046 [Linum perenne]